MKVASVVLSRSNISPAFAREILEYIILIDGPIEVSDAINAEGRLIALDYVLRMTTGRLGGMPSEKKDEDLDRIVRAGVDLNLSLRWVNERFDRIVEASRIQDREARVNGIKKLLEELDSEAKWMPKQSLLGGRSQTFRSNVVGQLCFMYTYPALEMVCDKTDEHEQYLDLIKIAAALAVYKSEHGHYPEEFAELSPSLLKEIPKDIYTNKPLCYKLVDNGFLLYSLFENEADDGATDVSGDIRNGEWQADKQEVNREKCDLVIRIPVVPRPKP